MERHSWCGQAGIGIQASTWRDLASLLDSAFLWDSLVDSVGDGPIGDLTGVTAPSFTTTTRTLSTAESLSIAATCARVRAAGLAERAFAAGAPRGSGALVEPQSRSI